MLFGKYQIANIVHPYDWINRISESFFMLFKDRFLIIAYIWKCDVSSSINKNAIRIPGSPFSIKKLSIRELE